MTRRQLTSDDATIISSFLSGPCLPASNAWREELYNWLTDRHRESFIISRLLNHYGIDRLPELVFTEQYTKRQMWKEVKRYYYLLNRAHELLMGKVVDRIVSDINRLMF